MLLLSLLPAKLVPCTLLRKEQGHKQQKTERGKEKPKKTNNLLYIVKTSRFRFQYGSMMKHFIKSNSKEDDIKLQWGGKEKKLVT